MIVWLQPGVSSIHGYTTSNRQRAEVLHWARAKAKIHVRLLGCDSRAYVDQNDVIAVEIPTEDGKDKFVMMFNVIDLRDQP